jgi:hypothetical protein
MKRYIQLYLHIEEYLQVISTPIASRKTCVYLLQCNPCTVNTSFRIFREM